MGYRYYLRRFDRRLIGRLFLGGLLLFLTVMLIAAAVRLRPILEQMATTRVHNSVNRVVAQAVEEAVASGDIRYEALVTLEKDHDGRVTVVRSNMAAFNRLQAHILELILERIDQISTRELSIPAGSLTGSALLAGRGPRISVRMESVGSSAARFENEFMSAGINQTRHQIVLHVNVSVSILLPGFTTATQVANEVTVAETIIVGAVPDTYTYFGTDPAAYREDLKDYVLNNS